MIESCKKAARRPVCTPWWPRVERTSCERIQHRTPDLERPEGGLTSESDAHAVVVVNVNREGRLRVYRHRTADCPPEMEIYANRD